MPETIGTAYIQIEPTTQGIQGSIQDAISGGTAKYGNALSGALGTAAKVGAAALGTAMAGVTAFTKSAIDAGKNFDSSMSQVYATMGDKATAMVEYNGEMVSSMDALRDYAQEMGRTTAFSASEAADALNYMALAGYDAQTSMDMLPNVLNLAAAGGIELARASDMVTDAQTALGLTLDETSIMVDQMAAASSNSNTSVEQLGDAFLKIGANARNLKGGTTELSTVLGVLADNGIKGSEAGTHLRNIMLSLTPSTDAAAAAWESLGVSAYDAEGNMRDLPTVFQELNEAMDGMSQEERTNTLSAMFNKTDLASINALLGTTGDRWDELTTAIEGADGAAEAMAGTQLDNLSGDITLFQSALEGAQIAVSDQLTPTLREFVRFGTDGISELTGAFQEGGLSGAMDALGGILSDGLNMIIGMLPTVVNAGMQLLSALGQGILGNLPVIIDAAVQIITMLVEGIVTALPSLVEGALQIIVGLATGISQMLPTLIPTIVEVMLQIVQTLIENIGLLIEGAIALVTGLAEGLIQALPIIIEKLPELVQQVCTALIENLPLLLEATIQIFMALGTAIIENFPLIVETLITCFGTILETLAGFGGDILAFIGEKFGEFTTSVAEGMTNIINNIITFISQLPTQLAYWAGFAIGSFIKFFLELPSKLTQIWNNVITGVTTFATNFLNKATEAAKGFFNNLINGIQTLPQRLRLLGTQLVGALSELPSKFLEIGSNIVQGVWNGISEGWNWLVDSVKDLAGSLLDGAKSALGIASPSKEFAKQVGQWIPAGIAKGIEDNMRFIDDAIADMTERALATATGNGIAAMSSSSAYALNGGYQTAGNVGGYNQTINVYSPKALTASEVARQTRNSTRNMVLALRGV